MKINNVTLNFFAVILVLLFSNNTNTASFFGKEKTKTSPLVTPSFELWNDTNQDIYFYFGKSELRNALRDAEKLGVGKLEPGQYTQPRSLAAISEVSYEHIILIIMVGSIDPKLAPVYVYFFNPASAIGKKIYLKFGKNYHLEPQEGGYFGFGGKSKGGHPLKNNITKNDFFFDQVYSIPALIQGWKTHVNPLWTRSAGPQEQYKSTEQEQYKSTEPDLIEQAWEVFPHANALRKQKAKASTSEISYAVLGVSPGVDQATLRKAWLSLTSKWHPDKHPEGDIEFVTKVSQIIQEAYQELK